MTLFSKLKMGQRVAIVAANGIYSRVAIEIQWIEGVLSKYDATGFKGASNMTKDELYAWLETHNVVERLPLPTTPPPIPPEKPTTKKPTPRKKPRKK